MSKIQCGFSTYTNGGKARTPVGCNISGFVSGDTVKNNRLITLIFWRSNKSDGSDPKYAKFFLSSNDAMRLAELLADYSTRELE